MTHYHYLKQRLAVAQRSLRSRGSQILSWTRSTRKLCQIVCRSGTRRALWVLDYIEHTLGGYQSHKSGIPIDKMQRPLPWYTYPTIEYLEQYSFLQSHVFEYGSGNGSRYWCARANTVTSAESDPKWYDRGLQHPENNHEIFLCTEREDYIGAIHRKDRLYDVIVIDGRYRYACAIEARNRIAVGGFIILDNSDWLPNTTRLLRDYGLTQVDFIGTGPVNSYAWCTSIFFDKQINIPRLPGQVRVSGGLVRISDEDNHLA